MQPPSPNARDDARANLIAVAALVAVHLALIGGGVWLRSVVLSTWQKGPLVDPAAPYAPENALILFPIAACVALDVYLVVLAAGWKALRRRWWLPVLALAVSCGASEAALRAYQARVMATWFRPHPTLHWVVRSDLDGFSHGTGNTPITTNGDGLREGPPSRFKPAGEYRVVVLGDSSNFGQGVTGTEMWEHQLQELLQPHFDAAGAGTVRVINAACPGWSTYHGVEMMRGVAGAYQPDLVIAGFNNDPGPEVMTDAARADARSGLAPINAVLFQSEAWLIAREATLAAVRRFSPRAQAMYAQRRAGAKPTYGKLGEDRVNELVTRVPLPDYLDNLRELQTLGEQEGWDTVWVNMPVNRLEPDLVERYVDWGYRAATFALGDEIDLPVIDVDGRWVRTRERGLHIQGHVFHPNATGHRRLAEQVARELLDRDLLPGVEGEQAIAGPPAADGEPDLRLGWSSLTPVHAHVGAVLEAHPDLPARHGLVVDDRSFRRGGPQGEAVAEGGLDAFFSCEAPALHMLSSRPDARIVGSPGVLGRIAVVGAAGASLDDLKGGRVGVAPGSTPDLDWARWSRGLGATTVPLDTDALLPALRDGTVDAIVGWDPWVEQWLVEGGGRWGVVQQRPFHSVLAVGSLWALSDATGRRPTAEAGGPRAARVVALVEEALRIAAADRDRYDARVAELSGWSVEVVRAVADQNALLAGAPGASLVPEPAVRRGLDRAARSLGRGSTEALFGAGLLVGIPPEPIHGAGPGRGHPKAPPKGPPRGGPPGSGERLPPPTPGVGAPQPPPAGAPR